MFQISFSSRYVIQPKLSVSYFGKYSIKNSFQRKAMGRYRIANDSVEGYCVYVGINDVPDFSANPAEFSGTLPISIATTPPVSGTDTYHVVVRKRNKYGLESQNQKSFDFSIDSSGNLVPYPITIPDGMLVTMVALGILKVVGEYSAYTVDLYPADRFRIWVGTSAPDVDVDVFNYEGTLEGPTFGVSLPDVYSPGTYHFAMVMYRSSDGTSSDPVTTTFEVPDIPDTPVLFN